MPERFGGAGVTFAEVAVICEEMGHAASANNYFGSAVLAVGTLKALQPSDTRDGLLADVASGAVRMAVALESSAFVPDAEGADRILVIANGGVVEPAVTVTPRPVLDETRRLATVTTDDVEAAEVLRRCCAERCVLCVLLAAQVTCTTVVRSHVFPFVVLPL